jgi:hypothetical protein
MFDMNGRAVLYTSVNENNTVDVSTLSKGVYIVKFINNNGEVLTKKVII